MLTFSNFSLRSSLQKAISDRGYIEPTEVQSKVIPYLLDNTGDVVVQASTGTGKTAAFALPLLEKMNMEGKGIQAVVLAPTRELALQVQGEFEKLCLNEKIKTVAIYGGASFERQIKEIRSKKPHIIVGTPGRIIDMLNRNILSFNKAEYIVLDEADEMLNMGFIDDVKLIIGELSKDHQSWMFSATMPKDIVNFIQKNFNNAEVIKTKKSSIAKTNIKQTYYLVSNRQKFSALYQILKVEEDVYGIIFCRTRQETQDLGEKLNLKGFDVDVLNGDLNQAQREKTMNRFRQKRVKILICTDVAARGIDVDNLTHVINYGLPREVEIYTHRIGRTGRAGQTGQAMSLITPDEFYRVSRIEKAMKTPIEAANFPSIEQIKESVVRTAVNKLLQFSDKNFENRSHVTGTSWDNYLDSFKNLDKEQILKLVFNYQVSKELVALEGLSAIEVVHPKSSTGGGGSRRGRGGRGGGGRGHRGRSRSSGGDRRGGSGGGTGSRSGRRQGKSKRSAKV